MNQLGDISYLAQTAEGQLLEQGITGSGHLALVIDSERGLIALAEGESESANPIQAIEILTDDMQLNLPSSEKLDDKTDTLQATQCLGESYENINEFLINNHAESDQHDQQKAVALAAIQFVNRKLGCAVVGEFSCLKFSGEKMVVMNELYEVNLKGDRALGLRTDFQMNMTEYMVESGDIILLTTLEVMQSVGEEHIRLTLTRFPDNLEMALRQINTRASRRGLQHKPVLILARIEEPVASKSGWLSRFGKST
jgi:hypothetical protein